MAEEVKLKIDIDSGGAANTLGGLKQQFEKLNEELEQTEIGSKRYKELNTELAQTGRQVKNLELGFESLDNEQIASEIGSVAGAVGDVTAAFVLLGGESDEMEKIAANIQTALGVSMAFKGAIEGFSSAFKLFNNVLKASPIFLLVAIITAIGVGIGFLITKWDEFTGFLVATRDAIFGVFNGIIEFFTGWTDAIQTTSMAEEKAHKKKMAQMKEIAKANAERLASLKKEQQELNKLHNKQIADFDFQIEVNELLGKSSRALTEEKLQNEVQFSQEQARLIDEQIASWTKYYEDLHILSGKSREDFKAQMRGQGIDLDLLLNEATDLQKKADQQIVLNQAKLQNFRLSGVEETNEEIITETEDYLAEMEKLENAFLDKKLDNQTREENAVRDKYFTIIELARQNKEDVTLLEQARDEELLEIREKFAEENKERQEGHANDLVALAIKGSDQIDERKQKTIDLAKQSAEDLFNVAQAFAKKQSQKDLKLAQEKVARGEKLTAAEVKRLQRQDKINKAFAVAQIAADTARGVSGAIAAGAGVPFPGNLVAIGSGVAAVLSGVMQASQILGEAVEIPSVDTSAASLEGSDGVQNTPDLRSVENGSTLLNDEPQQVVVVESITEGINSVAVIEAQSTFG